MSFDLAGAVGAVSGAGAVVSANAIAGIIAATLTLYVVSAACSFVQGWMMTSVSQRTCYGLRRAIAEKIDRMPVGYFERTSTGDTLSRITNDVDTLGQSLNQGVTQLITSVTTLIGVVVMMLSINPLLTGITVLILPVSLVLIAVVVKSSQKYFRAQQASLGAINGQVEETFSGHAIVRAFNQEGAVAETFGQTNGKLYESAWKSQFLSGLMMPVMSFVGNLGYVAVALVGSVLAVQGAITVGDIQAFLQYVKNFTQPITQLSQVGNVLQQMAAAAERIFAFLGEPELEPEQPKAKAADVPCDVEFDHVHFGYDPAKPIIKDFSAKVAEGQTVALVGPTGAGKTTMVKLLMRFYDVDAGAIRIGGTDVRDFSRIDVRDLRQEGLDIAVTRVVAGRHGELRRRFRRRHILHERPGVRHALLALGVEAGERHLVARLRHETIPWAVATAESIVGITHPQRTMPNTTAAATNPSIAPSLNALIWFSRSISAGTVIRRVTLLLAAWPLRALLLW